MAAGEQPQPQPQQPQVEILVHVAAPSTTAADAVPRQLARAYLAFQPASRTRLADAGPPDSPQLSFRSAWDNRASPRLPAFCSPPSQVGDSYPLPDAAVLVVSPTRILQRYLGATRASSTSPEPEPEPEPEAAGQDGADAAAVDVPSSLLVPGQVIPVTPPPPAQTRKRKREAAAGGLQPEPEPEPQDSAVFDVTHVSSSIVSHAEPPSPKPSTAPHAAGPAAAAAPAPAAPASTAPSSPPAHAAHPLAHALEIRPPSPPIGVAHLDAAAVVSAELAKLARDLSSRYRPDARRPTQPFERGHWLLDCARWAPRARRDTWLFLANYLASGLAGWGLWCRRDPPARRIRLYCWACVAKHAYLLLYLASGRLVKLTGARWVGADGEVAMEVPPSGGGEAAVRDA